jgi:hypothetical protein
MQAPPFLVDACILALGTDKCKHIHFVVLLAADYY